MALTDVAAEPLEAIISELRGGDFPVWGRPCDAADFEHFSALVAEVNEVYGPVAGASQRGRHVQNVRFCRIPSHPIGPR